MTLDEIKTLRQALWDNAGGHPLPQVHRNGFFRLINEMEDVLIEKKRLAELKNIDPEPPL